MAVSFGEVTGDITTIKLWFWLQSGSVDLWCEKCEFSYALAEQKSWLTIAVVHKPKINWPYLLAALLLIPAVYVGTLAVFPAWGQSVRLLVALAVAVIVGVFAFLANVRQTLEKPAAPPEQPAAPAAPEAGATNLKDVIGRDKRVVDTGGGDYYENPPQAVGSDLASNILQLPPLPGGGLPPSRAANFVDRGPIMNDLRQALRSQAAAAIVGVGGMGGIGKTELARFLAAEIEQKWPQSVMWITVADRSLAEVHGEMARSLGLVLSPKLTDLERWDALRAALQRTPRLVVLDDVRWAFAPSLPLCLPSSPPCAVLITSRLQELPGLAAGAIRPLNVMTEPQAVALLRGVPGLGEYVAREEPAARALCHTCALHPLALDLAARRLLRRLHDSNRPIADFNQNLTDRLAQLAYGKGPLDSLSANFEISFAGLSQADQVRFRRLAVFAPTGFSPAAAGAVWGDDEAAVRGALDRLENLSLVTPAEGPGRHQLHDLLRDYALTKLMATGEAEAAYRANAEYVLMLFAQHHTVDPSVMPEMSSELDNLRAAADWARLKRDGTLLARLATDSRNWILNVFHAVWREWREWLAEALVLGIEDDGLRANVLKAIGDVQQFRDEREAALESYQQALTLFRATGARLGEANVLKAIGDVQEFRDEREAALDSYQQALALYQAMGARLGEANVLMAIGDVQQFRMQTDAALESYQQALALFRATGARLGEANVLKAIGDVQEFRDEREAALESYQQALTMFKAMGDRLGEANVLMAIGDVQQFRKQTDAALESYQQALTMFKATGDRLGEANVLLAIGLARLA